MRITDDRLDELVDALVTGVYSSPCWTDNPALLLALAELQDRRDDEYEDADENYETALDLLYETVLDLLEGEFAAEDYSWARDADADADDYSADADDYSYEDYTNPEVDYDGDIYDAPWDVGVHPYVPF